MKNLDNPIDFARHRRRAATSGEFLMWHIVRNRQRCKMKFRREHPLGPYTCDFYCAEVKLDIECDGKDHFTEEGRARDAVRDAWMKRHGITTLRFTNQQIENDTQTVMNIIDGKLRELASPSPPAPLPEDGERGASPQEGSVHEKQSTTIHEQHPSYALPTLLPEDGERGARFQEDSVHEKQPTTIREQHASYALRTRLPQDGERDTRFQDGHVCEKQSSSIREQRPAYVLPPPRPVFGERGLGGEGKNARTLYQSPVCRSDNHSATNLRSRARTRAKSLAFTLIELLVTLVIVSVLAAATLPAFKNVIVERKTSVAALEVKAFLDAARARAISRGRPVSVILERLSSRWDGTYNTTTTPAIAQSSTANNSPSNVQDNYDVYNTCIRLVMAESLRPIEFELTGLSFVSETAAGVPPIMNDGDGLVELGRVMVVPNNDNRLATNLRVGNEIEILTPSDDTIRFLITGVVQSGANFFISIRNEGSLTQPYGTTLDVNRRAGSQEMITPFAFINAISSFRILPQPRPIASMVTELPKGSCVDLSLSGLSNDDPNVNPTPNLYRDCRREFASDWVLPPVPAFNNLPPIPSQLRPVYLTFGPTGKLASVLCNAPQVGTPNPANPLSYTSSLRRIEPQSDVCLFVGRTDQVIATSNTAELAAAEDLSLKPNLMDATGYWIRVSPSSGIISAAPAQASHIIEDVADHRSNPSNNEPIGHLLEDSRSLIFGAELTSQ